MTMVVAYFGTHVEGIAAGILDTPGQDSGGDLIDLYEADISVASFETRDEAEKWLTSQREDAEGGAPWE